MRGLFVTGTDTGVGKTFVASALAAWCRRRGFDVGVMKPVATGATRRLSGGAGGRWVSDDALRLVEAAGAADPLEWVNPVCFKEPLAPWTAARRARAPIRMEKIDAAFRALRLRHSFLIVEGVGGLLVPLSERSTIAEVAKRMRLPVVLVARPGLGTLNHTLLSLRCLSALRLSVRGIILNRAQPSCPDAVARLIERTNVSVLKRLTVIPVLGPLPFYPSRRKGQGKDRPAAVGRWMESQLGYRKLERMLY